MIALGDMIELAGGTMRALLCLKGGELRAWSAEGRDLLWPGDPAWWDASAPLLFPVVGWARNGEVRIDGIARPMGVHGFAASRAFRVVERKAASCRLELEDTEETRAAYPFAFRLAVAYTLTDAGLAVAFEVANRGARPMPYALGFHPGFRWPWAPNGRAGHAVHFEEDEATEVPVIAPGGLFSAGRRPVAFDGRRLPLSDEVFAAEALCFLDARSRTLALEAPDGSRIVMETEGFPHLALWSRPAAPFVCLEAWTGHGDPVGFAGELKDKPSMRLLEPGATDRAAVTLRFAGREGRNQAAGLQS